MTADNHPPALTHLTEDESMFQELVRDFAESIIGPRVREMEDAGKIAPEILKGLTEMGCLGIEVPESLGGAGCSFFLSCLAVEEISRVDAAVGVLVDVQNTLVVNAILKRGNDDQRTRYLPQLASGAIGAYALSEAGSGSDAFALACRATKTGDGYRLDGTKLWITNAADAEVFIVFATLDPALGYKGITAFLVDRDTPGFSIGKREDKLGIRASSTCEIVFEGCEIPAANLLGEEGRGYKIAIETLNEGRIGIGAQMVGVAQAALDLAVQYTQEREQFGKPISENQGVQFQLARMATDIELARLAVYNAARLRDSGQPFLREACVAKLAASEAAETCASMALELHGGYGYTREYLIEKIYRDAKIGKIYEGTSNMQLQTIAKILLGPR